MSRFVLDASTVLTWCFPDEQAQKAQEIAERIADGDTVILPAFWRHVIGDLSRLPVAIDELATPEIVFNTTQALCRKHGLTAYDAAYLEIAMRDRYALATTDDDLKRAAVAEDVRVL